MELSKEEKEFMATVCPCRWILTTPEHTKEDCPHYTFAAEKDFIRKNYVPRSTLQELEERVEKLRRKNTPARYIPTGFNLALDSFLALLKEVMQKNVWTPSIQI